MIPLPRPGRLRLGVSVPPVVLGPLDGITNALGLAVHSILAGAAGRGQGPGWRFGSRRSRW